MTLRDTRTISVLHIVLLAALVTSTSCKRERPPAPKGALTVSVEQHASWVRNFNPLVPGGGARWPTMGGVFEPLMIFNSMKSTYVPWLATEYNWSNGNTTLTFTVREEVQWSDGKPFSSGDVAFTFNLLKKHPALDSGGVWKHLKAVTALGKTVTFQFQKTYVPALQAISHQPIVPAHIWSKIDKPVSFSNEDPVATGPFTKVMNFQNQYYELGQNPHYWQRDKLKVTSLRFPAYPSNDQANLALVNGEVDWAGNFVPAIERIYVDKDPDHHGYWFPLVGSTVFLYPNTTKPPFDNADVRKALSMAIDRELMVKVAMYNYTQPADATGLSQTYDAWRDEALVKKGVWARHDREGANALLDEAGYKRGEDGLRYTTEGAQLKYELIVVSGWSDWVRAAQITATCLAEVGVTVNVKTYDFGAWFNKLQRGEFDLAISWSVEGQTPYDFYRWLMSSKTVKPVGENAPGNWHRFADPESDKLLATFEVTSARQAQEALAQKLQSRFENKAPAIPLFPNPSWGVFNTTRFEGFPTKDNPYAQLSPNKQPESLLVLLSLRPSTAGAQH